MTLNDMAKRQHEANATQTPRRHWLEPGECKYCDDSRTDQMMPYHDASRNCESGKHHHCTCDTCY